MAFAGFAHIEGRVFGFCELRPEAKHYPVTLHRTAVALMRQELRKHKYIYAQPDPHEPASEPWLERLGFRRLADVPGNLWRAEGMIAKWPR